jgi:hypothetical protein
MLGVHLPTKHLVALRNLRVDGQSIGISQGLADLRDLVI